MTTKSDTITTLGRLVGTLILDEDTLQDAIISYVRREFLSDQAYRKHTLTISYEYNTQNLVMGVTVYISAQITDSDPIFPRFTIPADDNEE